MEQIRDRRCSKCNGEMEIGFGADVDHNYVRPARWLKGPPQKGWWGGVKTSGLECRRIDYWRCTRCGLLEAYAVEIVNAPGFLSS